MPFISNASIRGQVSVSLFERKPFGWAQSIDLDHPNNYKTQRFGNWICFHPQVRGETRLLFRIPRQLFLREPTV
jgi:cytochrome c-type biogenesis protein CcmH/NrfF